MFIFIPCLLFKLALDVKLLIERYGYLASDNNILTSFFSTLNKRVVGWYRAINQLALECTIAKKLSGLNLKKQRLKMRKN